MRRRAGANPDKAKLVALVAEWRARSRLGVNQILGQIAKSGHDIHLTVDKFEYHFTTHVEQPASVPPVWVVAVVEVFARRTIESERCTASEALEFAKCAHLPFDWMPALARLFTPAEFAAALAEYWPAQALALSAPIQRSSQVSSLFVGREAELDALCAAVFASRFVTIIGMGGAGKTRLARVAFERLRDDFADGAWFVGLESAPESANVGSVFADMLRLEPKPTKSPLELVLGFFSHKRALLVLDNCEHVARSVGELATAAIASCPQLRILATSREPLNVATENIFTLSGLRFLAVNGLGRAADEPTLRAQLEASEAGQLFCARAAERKPGFKLTPRNAVQIAKICQLVEGSPLAIEIAASNIGSLSLTRLAAEFDSLGLTLKNRRARRGTRHHTLDAVLRWSFERLSPLEHLALGAASVFVGGLDSAGLVFVSRSADVVQIAQQLVAKSWLSLMSGESLASTPSHTRWTIHPVVRAFEVRAFPLAQRRVFQARHAEWFLRLAEDCAPHLESVGAQRWLDRLSLERDNLQVAVEWFESSSRRQAKLARLCAALWRFWQRRGDRVRSRQRLDSAHARSKLLAGRVAPITIASLAHGAGSMAFERGDYRSAVTLFAQAVARYRSLGDLRHVAMSLNSLSDAHRFSNATYAEVRAPLDESLMLNRQIGHAFGEASSLERLGNLAQKRGELDVALELHQTALRLRLDFALDESIMWTYRNLALVERDLGRFADAIGHFDMFQKFAREAGEPSPIALALLGKARCLLLVGRMAEAQFLLDEARGLFDTLVDRFGLAQTLNCYGEIARYQSDPDVAERHYRESLQLFRDIGNTWMQAWLLSNLGWAAGARGKLNDSARLHAEALALRRESLDAPSLIDSLEGHATLAVLAGDDASGATLFGLADHHREMSRIPRAPVEQDEANRTRAVSKARLGEMRTESFTTQGRNLTVETGLAMSETIVSRLVERKQGAR